MVSRLSEPKVPVLLQEALRDLSRDADPFATAS
jgi:hypothetical protein